MRQRLLSGVLQKIRTGLFASTMALDENAKANSRFMRRRHEAGAIPDYEKILERGYRCFLKPGSVVFDVGAHVGSHLRHFIQLVGPEGRVLAVEPLPGCFSVLESANFGPNVSLFNVALSNTKGIAKFVFAQGTPQESGFRQRTYNNPELANPVQIEVMTERLDDLAASLDRLDFIKIDAEGGEMLILEGATKALKRFRPILSVEYGRQSYSAYGNSPETLYRFAEKHAYIICDLFGAAITTLDTWRNVCDQTFWDWYLIPKDYVKSWQNSVAALSDIDAVLQSVA